MTVGQALALLESLTVAERKAIPREDYAWPDAPGGPQYPIDSQDHLDAAATLIGRAPENKQADIKARAIRIAKRHGFTLPDSWKAETTESVEGRPAKKIGTLKICWLEYGARSLNGRIYPKATCDRIYQSGLRRLADHDGLPITTFVSHETANSNVNTELAGRVVKLWQEGSQFWALIDLADTRAARDMLALAEGGYLKSGSMRVLGVELMHDRNYDLPLVVCQEGIEPDLAGIDLTTRPGLADSARITQVLYESSAQTYCIESFRFDDLSIETKEVSPPAMELPLYLKIVLGMLDEAFPSKHQEAHARIHDHLAGVLDEAMNKACHGTESVRLKAEAQLDEAGRAIAMKHATRLIAAHDEAAHACGMECEGCYASSDTDQDGDNPAAGNDPDNDGESRRKETPLTEAEMLAALAAKGFKIEAPKTAEEKLAALEARLAAQDAKLAQLTESAPPTQRQTLAQSQFSESTLQPEPLYEDGDYLKGELHPKNWRALANPQVPWPADLDPNLVLSELSPFLEYQFLNMQEAAAGRSLREQITLGLLD
jgi:hypothetical protein